MKRVEKPWGFYEVITEGKNYLVKRLVVLPKKRLSLQRHKHRGEHWIVVNGNAKAIIGDKEFFLETGDHAFVKVGEKHRLENPSNDILEIVEVWIGDKLSEDDIERIEDDYGRV